AVEIGGQLVAVALVDKGAHFVRRGGRDLAGREGAGSQRQQAVERQGAVGAGGQQAARRQLFERADQAQRGAAQAERVAFAGGRQADAPDADQGFGALGDEQDGGGQRVGGDRRVQADAVLVAQRPHHVGGLAVAGGVVGAHDALQLGEFAHHVGAQVGLGQQGGAVGRGGVAAQQRRHAARD